MKKSFRVAGFLVATVTFVLLFAVTVFATSPKAKLDGVNTVKGILLQWNEYEGVYYYEVYRSEGKKSEKLLLSKVQTTSFEDTEATQGKTYNYSVVPVFSDYSTGAESEKCTVYRLESAYISRAGSQRNGISIKWKSVKNAKGYRVYRKAADETEWSTVAKFGAGVREFVDGEISPGQVYTYCVKAFMGEYESASGNEKQLSYTSFPEVKGIVNTDDGVLISWEGTSEAVYYMIYKKTGHGEYAPYALLDSTYNQYEDKGAVSGQLSSYYICSADADGNLSSFDRELSVRFIQKSVITAATNTSKGIKLYWNKSEGCQGYAIFRKDLGSKNWKLRGVVYGDNNLSAVDSNVKNNKIYTYTVRAFRDKFMATYNEEGDTLRFYSAPEKISVKGDAKSGYTVKWSNVKGVEYYAVYRKEADSDWTYMGVVKKNTFFDKSVKAKTKYTYGVEAYEGSVLRSGKAEVSTKK